MDKPYDIRERAFKFSCDVVLAYPAQRMDARAQRIWLQFVSAGTSGGAHLEEADAASSRAHFITLNRGALRELREAKYWIRLIAATKLPGWEKAPPLIKESAELVAIVTTIVKRASENLKANRHPAR
ncbi:MAG TPA: four helix bundle protein [Vicinamibacterales bacterium]|nr:four helix bundle protein [Vicinamibacterales bacterium]